LQHHEDAPPRRGADALGRQVGAKALEELRTQLSRRDVTE